MDRIKKLKVVSGVEVSMFARSISRDCLVIHKYSQFLFRVIIFWPNK